MNVRPRINMKVEVPVPSGNKIHTFFLDGESLCLQDLFKYMQNTKWGKSFIQDVGDGLLMVIPGYLMVLEGKMVPAWKAKDTLVADGQLFKLVRVVAGG